VAKGVVTHRFHHCNDYGGCDNTEATIEVKWGGRGVVSTQMPLICSAS